MAILKQLEESGVILNKSKCEFYKSRVKFLGQIIDYHGVKPDLDKIAEIIHLRKPTCVSDICRFLGMANQLSKFSLCDNYYATLPPNHVSATAHAPTERIYVKTMVLSCSVHELGHLKI